MFNFNFLSHTQLQKVRGVSRPLFALVGFVLANGTGSAQQAQVPFEAGSRSNVEVRHIPGAQAWPGTVNRTTNAVGAGGRRTPPTIERTTNGVKATLNPSWFINSRRQVSASGKVSIVCDEGTGSHSGHSHARHEASKKRVSSPKKAAHATRRAR